MANQINLRTEKEVENKLPKTSKVKPFSNDSNIIGKSQRENEIRAKQGNNFRQGRWTKEEHFRFLEALKLHGKEWRKVQ